MPSIGKTLYDLCLILLVFMLGLASSELTRFKLFSSYVLPFLVDKWYIPTVIISVLVLIIVLFKSGRGKGFGIDIITLGTSPPRFKRPETEHFKNYAGVEWIVWLGYDLKRGGQKDRLWVEGPRCSKCSYQLDQDKSGKKWYCLKCNKYTRIPRKLRENVREKMIKLFTAGFERQERHSLSSD